MDIKHNYTHVDLFKLSYLIGIPVAELKLKFDNDPLYKKNIELVYKSRLKDHPIQH